MLLQRYEDLEQSGPGVLRVGLRSLRSLIGLKRDARHRDGSNWLFHYQWSHDFAADATDHFSCQPLDKLKELVEISTPACAGKNFRI